ncbi:MAG: thioesterase [Deltaproteobacteria bacterium SG8_13]|nr:MAG: thioesterase [Deltaproteobacteria bacterium SG8_13]
MESTLQPGMTFEFAYEVPADKTVPHLYPEAPQLQEMPQVFATGYLVGLIEWACIEAINPHIDWPRQQTVGIHIDISHTAATPPGFTVTVKGTLTAVEGRKLTFAVEARDELDRISTGTHQRFLIDAERFNQSVVEKAGKAG